VKECCDSYLLIEEVDFARFEPSCNELWTAQMIFSV
jgi:hypothetical protein